MTYGGDTPPPVSPGLVLRSASSGDPASAQAHTVRGGPSKAAHVRGAIAALLVTALVIAGRGHWLVARAATRSTRFDAFDIPVFGVLFTAGCAILIFAVIVELVVLRRSRAQISSWTAGLLCVAASAVIIVTGLVSALIPTGWLPTSSRRALITLHSGLGAWLAMLAALTLVFWSRSPGVATSFARVATQMRRRDPKTLMGFAVVVAIALSAWSRYQPWLQTSAGTDRAKVPGWGIPFAGSLGLIGVMTLAFSVVMWIRFSHAAWLLVMAGAGWLLSLVAALTVIVGSVLEQINLSAWLPGRAAGSTPHLSVSWGAWLAFAAGCSVAAIAAALLTQEPRKVPIAR